mmetsp:Transcript_94762/g.306444  ORF Transcript_94762/g.306444 Transcript_94762/m.306444 type:complete len:389 (+) Transcript_94762:943-2109(+)
MGHVGVRQIGARCGGIVSGPGGAVVVEAVKIRRPLEELLLMVREIGQAVAVHLPHLGGVVALLAEDGIGHPAELEENRALCRGDVLGGSCLGLPPIAVVGDADLPALVLELPPVKVHDGRVRVEQIVAANPGVRGHVAELRNARCLAPSRGQVEGGPRLVEGHPGLDAVAEGLEADLSIVNEFLGDRAIRLAFTVAGPPAPDLGRVQQALWQIPMVQGNVGRDACLEQCVDQAVVECLALLVDAVLDLASRDQAGPGDGEAVMLQSHGLHHSDVRLPHVIVIGSNIARRALVEHGSVDVAGGLLAAVTARGARHANSIRTREGIPNRCATAILPIGAFDLVCGSAHAPDEVLGELALVVVLLGILPNLVRHRPLEACAPGVVAGAVWK